MATFYYNQSRTKEIQVALENSPEGTEVYFSPTAAGMIQVIKMKDLKEGPPEFREDIKCSSRRGHDSLRNKLFMYNDTLKLDDKFLKSIKSSKTFRITVSIDKEAISYRLKGNKRKESQ